MSERRIVSVFGSGDARPSEPQYALAEEVGRVLAGLGYGVATGGYAGAMEAVSRAARQAGAEVIGVTCRVWPGRANPFVTRVIETADLHERLRTLIELGTGGYAVLPGATGTLLELAAAWELASKAGADRPIVCVGEYWRCVVALIAKTTPSAALRIAFADGPCQLARHFRPI